MVKNYNKYIKEAFESEYNIHNFDVGDEVVVNDEIRDWVKKRNWSEDMLDCIGKSFIIRNITPTYDTCQVTFVNKGFWWPIQCLDPVGGKNVKWYYKEK